MSQLSIGQFSKMTRLSIKALRLYDEKKLLHPKYINSSNNYRYYSPTQVKEAEIIRVLRACNMPLDNIRGILGNTDNQQTRDQLRIFRAQLSNALDHQMNQLSYLDELLNPDTETASYEFRTEHLDIRNVAGIRLFADFQTVSAVTSIGFQQLFYGLQGSRITTQGPPMTIYHHLIDPENSGEIEFCAPILQDEFSSSLLRHSQLQAGTVAYVIHKGEQHKLVNAYRFIISKISEAKFEFAGPPREIYLNDPNQVAVEALLTRIEFPIIPFQNKKLHEPV